jgi:hypothetical protein
MKITNKHRFNARYSKNQVELSLGICGSVVVVVSYN